jgi:hypothetical protein
MKYTCTLTVVSDDGSLAVERVLTTDEAIPVLAIVLSSVVANPIEEETATEERDDSEPRAKSKKRNKCSLCGKSGHSKRTCPGLKQHADEAPSPRRFLSREDYDKVRSEMHEHNFMSNQFALTNKLSPKEVNAAVPSIDYEDYRDTPA